jgi:hypothetical protein|tara:strand:- start:16351 stop:16680 length:330 start_codon:yes stop_codon:yes gene_type:complete
MNNNYRLTVHVTNQPKVDTKAPIVFKKKGPEKSAVDRARENSSQHKAGIKNEDSKGRFKTYTTLSFYCRTKEQCLTKLNDVKTKYDIAIGKNRDKASYGKELYNIAFVN